MLTTAEITEAVRALALPRATTVAERQEQRATEAALEAQWREWLRDEYADNITDAAHEAIMRLAWEYGHASGYHEVEYHYQDLVVIAHASR